MVNDSPADPQGRSRGVSRRGLFGALARPFTRPKPEVQEVEHASQEDGEPRIAIIQGRFCIAYQGGMCFTCSEQCPEEGAITLDKGIPTVHADLCTGCGICHDLCPAPRNAILVAKPPPTNHGLSGPDDKPTRYF